MIAAITQLLEAGKRDGTIRADADPRDYLQLTGALWRAAIGAGTPIAAALKAAVPPTPRRSGAWSSTGSPRSRSTSSRKSPGRFSTGLWPER